MMRTAMAVILGLFLYGILGRFIDLHAIMPAPGPSTDLLPA
jgi:hypothetical protein